MRPAERPRLGEHNAEILAELGYDDAAHVALAERGVIGTEHPVAIPA